MHDQQDRGVTDKLAGEFGEAENTNAIMLRWDATSKFLRCNKAQNKLRHTWVLNKLKALEGMVSEEQMVALSDMMAVPTVGLFHVQSSRARVRWSSKPEDSERLIVKRQTINTRAKQRSLHSTVFPMCWPPWV